MVPTFGNPRPVFYVVASDGVSEVQVTSSTKNPMTVIFDDPHDGQSHGQAFVFRGDWGINFNKIKIREVTPGRGAGKPLTVSQIRVWQ